MITNRQFKIYIDKFKEFQSTPNYELMFSKKWKNFPRISELLQEENIEKLNVRQIVMSSVMTAFGLVVALVWKDTIVATVDYLLPNTDDGTLQGMYISALAVTMLVIILAKFAINLNERVEKEIDRVQSYFYEEKEGKKKE